MVKRRYDCARLSWGDRAGLLPWPCDAVRACVSNQQVAVGRLRGGTDLLFGVHVGVAGPSHCERYRKPIPSEAFAGSGLLWRRSARFLDDFVNTGIALP